MQFKKLSNIFSRSLLPCPFCGGLPSLNVYRDIDTFESKVSCSLCCVSISRYHSDLYKSVDLVVDSWNSRVG